MGGGYRARAAMVAIAGQDRGVALPDERGSGPDPLALPHVDTVSHA